MIEKVFFDANIILDLIDIDRGNLEKTRRLLFVALEQDITLCTCCDVLSNIYYVTRKKIPKEALIAEMLRLIKIFDIKTIDHAQAKAALEKNALDTSHDFEDLLQSECASNHACQLIVTNDKKFVVDSVQVVCTDEALNLLVISG